MKYGYARVSTLDQDLSDQIKQLIDAGVPRANIFNEKYTGTRLDRPQFDLMMKHVAHGDEIIVTKLDRLGRKTSEVTGFLDQCFKDGIIVNILATGRLDNTASGKLMRNILSSFAEFERDMIVARTQEGKAYAKAHNKNFHEGRPKRRLTPHNMAIFNYAKDHSYTETAQAFNCGRSTVYRIVKQVRSNGKD